MANNYTLYGYFESSGVAKTGLTDVTAYIRSASAGTLVVNGLSATEIGNGWYRYIYNGTDDAYSSIMVTADTTVDRQNVPWITDKNDVLLLSLIQTNLDVAITTRLASASYTAPDNTSVTAIKAKTDNLPTVPASKGDVDSLLPPAPMIIP